MKRLPWLLALLLSGCLGGQDATDPAPDAAAGSVPSLDLEGLGCLATGFVIHGPGPRIQERMPPGYRASNADTVAPVNFVVHECRSVQLGDRFQEDVVVAVAAARIHPPQGADPDALHSFLLEAYTDWPALADAWAADGVEGHPATFSRSDGAQGETVLMEADGVSYRFQSAYPSTYPVNKTAVDFDLHAGDGSLVYDYDFTLIGFDFLARTALVQADGGFLATFTDGATTALLEAGQSSLVLRRHADAPSTGDTNR